VARFWAGWHTGQGSYLDWRDETFAGKTLDELYEEILADQNRSASASQEAGEYQD
jgi:hypothetical protein